MKKCRYCGCVNQNDRQTCADCGQTLASAEPFDDQKLDRHLEDMYNRSDPFYFGTRKKILFYVSLGMILADILLAVFFAPKIDCLAFSVLFFIYCAFNARFGGLAWELEKFSLRFKVDGDLEPSYLWLLGQTIGSYGSFILGFVLLALGFFVGRPSGESTAFVTYRSF